MASQRKRKRSIIDELFGNPLFDETHLIDEFPEGGYSISVIQTPEGTKVKTKVSKNTDTNTIKRQLQQQYPNATIEIEGGKNEPLIKEISTKTLKKQENKEEQNQR